MMPWELCVPARCSLRALEMSPPARALRGVCRTLGARARRPRLGHPTARTRHDGRRRVTTLPCPCDSGTSAVTAESAHD